MGTHDRWRPNANEAPVMADFSMGVRQVGTVGGLGWGGLRWLARRLGLPVAEPRPESAVACSRCGAPALGDEPACVACGRALPPRPAVTAAQIAALSADAERRWRRDLTFALLFGLLLGLGILQLAQSLERGTLKNMGLQLWWLAGLFWGLVVFVNRRWLDQ